MIVSMTAYGRETDDGDWGQASCEIRTVNHRYLEMSIRVPEALRGLEQAIREKVSAHLNRGKVDCIIQCEPSTVQGVPIMLNQKWVASLIAATENLAARLNRATDINPLDILAWPGVIQKNTPDSEGASNIILALLENTLNIVVATRRREGEKITRILKERCVAISRKVSDVRDALPDILANQRERLRARANALGQELDQNRLELELLILAQKYDVAEELDRLDVHIQETNRVMLQDEPVGRRLDFLMQEMNREANTLGSKSAHVSINQASIDLKVGIEQLREQIQNIE